MPDGRDNDKQCPNAFPLTPERIYASTVDGPQMFNLRVGTIRQRSRLPPRMPNLVVAVWLPRSRPA